jgi:GNAT superfamily N-acetyltransferase
MGKLNFEAAGFIVAEREGKVAGFAHAGFGPSEPSGPSHRLCYEMGTVGMLVVEPAIDDPALEEGLLVEAERYLKSKGATVVYAGGQYPINPFYWGLYGSSEWAGILSAHKVFHGAVKQAGYEAVSTTALMEADLSGPEHRDPRTPLIRRQTRIEIREDMVLPRWWDELAIGAYHATEFRLLGRPEDVEVARATTWDMDALGYGQGRRCMGLVSLEVDPAYRRRGYGRYLVSEILRHGKELLAGIVSVQTSTTNRPALVLYEALGFRGVDTATLYRLPVGQGLRQAGEAFPPSASAAAS